MTLPIRVRTRAELDVDDGYAWYESRAEGLGEAFLRAVDLAVYHGRRRPRRFDP